MPTRTNTQRAKEIRSLILKKYDPHDVRSSIIDALTDLRHLAQQERIHWGRIIDSSLEHYLIEQREEKES